MGQTAEVATGRRAQGQGSSVNLSEPSASYGLFIPSFSPHKIYKFYFFPSSAALDLDLGKDTSARL